MDSNKILDLETIVNDLKKQVEELKQALERTGVDVKDWNNVQLKRPLDAQTISLLEDTVKDLRNNKRSRSITSSATPEPNCETDDVFIISALAAAATISAPRGNPTNTQMLLIRIEDNGTARALTWNSIYRAGLGLTLPSTTILGKMLYVGFLYNSTDLKWDLLGFQDGF